MKLEDCFRQFILSAFQACGWLFALTLFVLIHKALWGTLPWQ